MSGTRAGSFHTKMRDPADGLSLVDESEVDKGVRMLRVLRDFNRSRHGVFAMQIDGQLCLVVKHDPEISPNVDTDRRELQL